MADSTRPHRNPQSVRQAWEGPEEKDNFLQRLESLQTKIPQLDDLLRKFNDQFISTKEDLISMKLEYENKIQHSSPDTALIRVLEKTVAENEELIGILRAEKDRLEQMVKFKEEELKNNEKKVEKLEDEQRKQNGEISNLRSRLSQVMGNKLTDNNPAIADLSDKNRPSKLGEKFSELYDNAWTDAFEEIHNSYDEKDTIKKLLQMLMHVHERCRKFWIDYTTEIERAFQARSRIEITDFIMKQLKDFLKNLAPELVEQIYKQVINDWNDYSTRSLIKSEPCGRFVRGCVECCVLMAAQDPPVTIHTMERRIEDFDHNLFRPYTKTGNKLDYVVWPPLYLHKDGPLLCKGVAQAVKTERATSAPASTRDTATRSNGNTVSMQNSVRLFDQPNTNMDSLSKSLSISRTPSVSMDVTENERNYRDQNSKERPNIVGVSSTQTNYHQSVVPQGKNYQEHAAQSSNYPTLAGSLNWRYNRYPNETELNNFTYYTNRNLNESQIRRIMGDYAFNLCRDFNIYVTKQQMGWG